MNTAIILTTRISSSRLPQKALLQINGETVTDILINRLKKTKIPIVMACPDTLEDRLFMKPVAERHGIGFMTGDVQNVIKRHLQACEKFNIDYVILSEGDDWFICKETINAVFFKAKELGFKKAVITEGLPFGMNVIAYPRENLGKTEFSGDTGWGAYVTKDAFVLKFNYERPYRLSMDYLLDMEVMEDVYLKCKRNEFVGGIVNFLDKHPEIARKNTKLTDGYWEKIKEARKNAESNN